MKSTILAILLSLSLGIYALWGLQAHTTSAETFLQAMEQIEQASHVHYVAADGDCGGMTPCYDNIQSAVDAANTADEIKVAGGVYTGVTTIEILNSANFTATQIVAITKSITLRGGYNISNWDSSDPVTNETVLDAQGQGRVMVIMGEVSPIVEGFTLTNGNASNLGGHLTYAGLCTPLNYPVDGGGGLYISRANATIQNNKISGNIASNTNWSGGGGIMLNCSSALIADNEISLNTGNGSVSSVANNAMGGGIFATGMGANWDNVVAPVISSNIIQFNVAGGSSSLGGGIYVGENIAATIANNHITQNDTTLDAISGNGSGGGIYARFIGNQLLTITGNTILSNQTGSAFLGFGGGIHLYYVNDFLLVNNIVATNRANGAGTAMYIRNRQAGDVTGHLLHNTIYGNFGANQALYFGGEPFPGGSTHVGTISLTNNIIAGHNTAYRVFTSPDLTMNVEDSHTLWDGNGAYEEIIGDGSSVNITNRLIGNPGLIGFGNYRLTSASAAINAGIDTGLNSDIDGDLRPIGPAVDIGADEFHVEATIPTDGGIIDGTNAQGHGPVLDIPEGAIDQPTTFILTPRANVGEAHPTLSFAGQVFTIVAIQNDSPVPNFTFLTPVTLMVNYAEGDIERILEETVELLYWDGAVWTDDGIVSVSHDMVNNQLTVTIEHLSEFAMFGEGYLEVYLPVIIR
jgi:hypothetical protein